MSFKRNLLLAMSAMVVLLLGSCGSDDNIVTTFNAVDQLAEDIELIDKYLVQNGYEADTTDLEVRMVVFESGSSRRVEEGELISFDYVGRLLDENDEGEIIDTTFFDATIFSVYQEKINEETENNPIKFRPFNYSYSANGWTLTSQSGGVDFVVGFRDGLTQLFKNIGEGGRAEIILPSGVAYGQFGLPPGIPGNQTLIFEIFLRDIED